MQKFVTTISATAADTIGLRNFLKAIRSYKLAELTNLTAGRVIALRLPGNTAIHCICHVSLHIVFSMSPRRQGHASEERQFEQSGHLRRCSMFCWPREAGTHGQLLGTDVTTHHGIKI